MKIAVFHNFLDNIGGAEIVTLTLARELKADLYTTNIDKEKIKRAGFEDILPRIKSIGKVPLQAPFRHQAALWRFSRIKLDYDHYIISGDWAVSAAKRNRPVLWYVHSPCRELWDLRGYVRNNIVPFYFRFFYDIWTSFNRWLHPKYIKKIDKIVCNSKNTQKRLKKYLGIEAGVIYPPTEVSKHCWRPAKNYWLSVNRLLKHKRIEIQLESFQKLPKERLIIVGSYEKNARQFEAYKKEIERKKPKNVEIRHWVSSEELKKLYSECKGLICTAKDEDFGMTPVEAMASGKPVIAAKEGGYKETVIDGKAGKLIKASIDELVMTIKEVGKNPEKYKEYCLKRAGEFDVKKFVDKIKEKIK